MISKNFTVAAITYIAIGSQFNHSNIAQSDAEPEMTYCLAGTDTETTMYTDKYFMPNKDSLFWGDIGESNCFIAK